MKIVVVGAGIVGVCSASYLLRDGHEVVLVDRGEPGDGCSKGNAGALSPGSCIPMSAPGVLRKVPKWLLDPLGPLHIRPSYLPRAVPWLARFAAAGRAQNIDGLADALRAMHRHTFENYAPLVSGAGCTDLIRRTGTLVVFKNDRSLADSQREWDLRAARQVRQQRLAAAEMHALVPGLSAAYRHGILLPEHGFVADPHRLTRSLAGAFVEAGGTLLQTSVDAIEDAGPDGARLRLADGELTTDRCVLAAGAWSTKLLWPLGLRLPLETQRGYHVMVAEPNVKPLLPVVSADGKIYATPMEHGLRFAGTVEFAGLEAPPDDRRADALVPLARDLFPDLRIDGKDRWMGHRPCLPDSLPVVGPVAGHPALLLAFGHGHHGMTGASTTGRLVADMIARRAPEIDPAPYRADRF